MLGTVTSNREYVPAQPNGFISETKFFLAIRTLEAAVLELPPNLAGYIWEPMPGRPVRFVDIADHRVVFAVLTQATRGRGWMIEDGRPGNHSMCWPLGTPTEALAEAAVARVDLVRAS